MNASPTRLLPAAMAFLVLVVALAAIVAPGAPVDTRADTSGSNESGYAWTDSSAPEPTVTFGWIDATGGTPIPSTDCDNCADIVALPFTFNFFGTDYTEIVIGTNGLLSFNTADPNGCNVNYNEPVSSIPHGDTNCSSDGWGANPLIASWFDDLDPEQCGDIYYDTFGTHGYRQFVIEFYDVCHHDCSDCAAGEGITFETILFETSNSNDIEVQYLDTSFGTGSEDLSEEDGGGTATTGINKDATTGLLYHAGTSNGAVLSDNLAVYYYTNEVELVLEKTAIGWVYDSVLDEI